MKEYSSNVLYCLNNCIPAIVSVPNIHVFWWEPVTVTIGRFPLGSHILRIRASCMNIIFYCNCEVFRYSGDYFLSLFLNCFLSSFVAVFTNLFLGTLGSKPNLYNNL